MIPSPHSPPPPSPQSRQSKVVMQRQYREKEGMCFNKLRDVIKELTGEESQTRQEILTKVINLLLAILEIRKREAQVVPSGLCEILSSSNPTDTTLAHLDSSAQWQSPHCPQTWHSNAEFDTHIAQFHGQQYQFNADSVLDQVDYQEYSGEEWPGSTILDCERRSMGS